MELPIKALYGFALCDKGVIPVDAESLQEICEEGNNSTSEDCVEYMDSIMLLSAENWQS